MTTKLTAIYARVSSQQQKQEATIDSQVAALLEYAKKHNLYIPSGWIFKDNGYSGSSLDRPSLDELRDLVRDGDIDNVLVYSPDRLARRFSNQLILEEEFLKRAVKIIYLNGAKGESPEDLLLKNFQGIFAEYERSQILDRSRRGKLYRARQGNKQVLPNAPYGYYRNRADFYSINPEQAVIVNEIFTLYTKNNLSMKAIARYLEAKDVISPTGASTWCPTTIRGILNNPAYTGTAYYGKTENGIGDISRRVRYKQLGVVKKPKKPKRDKPREEWISIPVPPIISVNDFEAAKKMLTKNKEFSKRNTKDPSILQGLLVCGCCGGSYYKRKYGKGPKQNASYYCMSQVKRKPKWCGNPPIKQEVLDSLVWDNVMNLIRDPSLIEAEIQRRMDDHPKKKETEGRLRDIEKEINRLKRAKDKLLDAYQETECLGLNEFRTRMKLLNTRESEFVKEQEALNAYSLWNEQREYLQLTVEEFRRQIDMRALDMTVEHKQKILRAIIEEVVIKTGEITINHTISLTPVKNCQLSSGTGG